MPLANSKPKQRLGPSHKRWIACRSIRAHCDAVAKRARPLERLWRRSAEALEPVAELPSPPLPLRARQQWLRQAMRGTWRELNDLAPAGAPDYLAWRQTLLDSLDRLHQNSVVVSHFIAIKLVNSCWSARAPGHDGKSRVGSQSLEPTSRSARPPAASGSAHQ